MRNARSVIGVHFRPGGASPFLDVPASELAETHVDLETLWGRAALELRERLCAAATPAERFSLLEQMLTARLTDAAGGHGAVPKALAAFEQTTSSVQVRDVARQVGLSHRGCFRRNGPRFLVARAWSVACRGPDNRCGARRYERLDPETDASIPAATGDALRDHTGPGRAACSGQRE